MFLGGRAEAEFFVVCIEMFRRILRRFFPGSDQIPAICTVVNFCTHDFRFLRPCIKETARFSQQILVACSDHFFDGKPENPELLDQARRENPEAEFILLPYDAGQSHDPQFWVTLSRWNALSHVKPEMEYILFLDADEIVDGSRFATFLKSFPVSRFNILKFGNYYYFRESKYRAKAFEDSVTLGKKKLLSRDLVVDYEDRNKAWESLPEPKQRMITDKDGTPMIHHFSWVRTKEEMLRKVLSWGHAGERDWQAMVEEEFSRPFSGKDFVHDYSYEEVQPPFPEIGL